MHENLIYCQGSRNIWIPKSLSSYFSLPFRLPQSGGRAVQYSCQLSVDAPACSILRLSASLSLCWRLLVHSAYPLFVVIKNAHFVIKFLIKLFGFDRKLSVSSRHCCSFNLIEFNISNFAYRNTYCYTFVILWVIPLVFFCQRLTLARARWLEISLFGKRCWSTDYWHCCCIKKVGMDGTLD